MSAQACLTYRAEARNRDADRRKEYGTAAVAPFVQMITINVPLFITIFVHHVHLGYALTMAVRLLSGNTDYEDLYNIQQTPFHIPPGKIIGIYSPAELNAYDGENNHTGPTEDGTIEVNIPGSSYDYIGESKFIYLPDGGNYTIKTKATGEGSFDLKVKTYTDSTLSKELLYLDVPQTTSTTTSMALDTDTPTLEVDTDNDGTVDENLSPSSTLTGNAIADTEAPTTSVQATGTEGTDGWYRSDVSLSFSGTDSGSGILNTYYYKDGEQTLHDGDTPLTLNTEGTTKVWYFSVDKAGNTEQPKSITIKIDKTNPTITYKDRTNPNADGWNKTDVTVNWTCTDQTSGVVDAEVSKTLNTDGQDQSTTGVCTDKAGNTVENTQSGIKIDKTEPSITISVPENDKTYILNSTTNANWQTSDGLSGIAEQTGTTPSGSPIDTSTIGAHQFTASATDKASNTKTQTISYKVIYRFDGFLQPINDTGHTETCGADCTISIFKGGSTVPVKLQLKDANGNTVQSTTPPQWINPQQGSAIADSINETDFTDPTDSGTTYNWDGTQYHYNWKTKDIPSGYHWLIGARLDDGQTYTVNIGLR